MISRSEKHQQAKADRRRKARKLAVVNSILFISVIIIAAVAFVPGKEGRYAEQIPYIGEKLDWIIETSTAWMKPDGDGKNMAAEQNGKKDVEKGNSPSDSKKNPADDESSANGEEQEFTEEPDGNSQQAGSEVIEEEEGGFTPVDGAATVSMSFVGDILIEEYVQPFVNLHGYSYLFEKALLYLSEPDLTIGNLEMPITTRGVPSTQKYVYKGSPEVIKPLLDAGFDIVSLANNHALDQGIEGLQDTIAHLDKAGLEHAGTGNNDTEAYAPVIKEMNGMKIAFVSVSKVIPYAEWKATANRAGVADSYDEKRAVAAVEAAKQAADLVVVLVHWGTERTTELNSDQLRLGKAYIDAGADLIIGNHPHILQGFEQYKGKWIVYSLGNFIFSSYPKDAEAETGVLDAVCTKDGHCELKFNPMLTVKAQPAPMEAEAAAALFNKLESISIGAKVSSDGRITAKK